MDAPVLDRDHLARYTGGDSGLEAELFTLLDAQIDACVSALAAARGVESWVQAAHTLKGAARGVGAMRLGAACAQAEESPMDEDALDVVRGAAEEARAAMRDARAA